MQDVPLLTSSGSDLPLVRAKWRHGQYTILHQSGLQETKNSLTLLQREGLWKRQWYQKDG